MSFITKNDLATHFYEEKIDVITRGDDSLVDEAIDEAIDKATGYLNRYDYDAIFATTVPTDRIKYKALIGLIKDIAKFLLIKKCNAGVDIQLAKECYDDAIAELGKIQSGRVIYSKWPIPEGEEVATQSFTITSQPKRETYY